MERVDLTILATNNQNRGVTDGKVFDKIIPRLRNLLDPADIEPRFAKDPGAFLLKIFR